MGSALALRDYGGRDVGAEGVGDSLRDFAYGGG